MMYALTVISEKIGTHDTLDNFPYNFFFYQKICMEDLKN